MRAREDAVDISGNSTVEVRYIHGDEASVEAYACIEI